MNIFVLDKNPERAARMLCDKHIPKMILESAQLLCTCHWMKNSSAPYKPTHKNHPCSKWVRESLGNYNWLLRHAIEMCKEFKKRYKKDHKSCEIINWCQENKSSFSKRKRTPFVQAMPQEYRQEDSIKAYKEYYINEKLHFCKWQHSRKPKFIRDHEKQIKK